MKKTYCKPRICFEDFELAANIAGGCTVSSNQAKNQCAYDIPGIGKLFIDQSVCEIKVFTDGQYGLCYHVPMDSNSLFSS